VGIAMRLERVVVNVVTPRYGVLIQESFHFAAFKTYPGKKQGQRFREVRGFLNFQKSGIKEFF